MMDDSMPLLTEPISDETAHALSEILSWVSITFDNTYYAQIRRHLEATHKNKGGCSDPSAQPI